jgi:hypothetical protein
VQVGPPGPGRSLMASILMSAFPARPRTTRPRPTIPRHPTTLDSATILARCHPWSSRSMYIQLPRLHMRRLKPALLRHRLAKSPVKLDGSGVSPAAVQFVGGSRPQRLNLLPTLLDGGILYRSHYSWPVFLPHRKEFWEIQSTCIETRTPYANVTSMTYWSYSRRCLDRGRDERLKIRVSFSTSLRPLLKDGCKLQ